MVLPRSGPRLGVEGDRPSLGFCAKPLFVSGTKLYNNMFIDSLHLKKNTIFVFTLQGSCTLPFHRRHFHRCPYLDDTFGFALLKEAAPRPGLTDASLEGVAETLALGRRHMLAVAAGGRSPRVMDERTPGVCTDVLAMLPPYSLVTATERERECRRGTVSA